jgi:hypothetical protein
MYGKVVTRIREGETFILARVQPWELGVGE